jgi:hypothetical protein
MRVYFDIQVVAKASALGMKRGLSNLRMSLIRCTASFCSATSVDVEESLYKRAQALGIAVVTISQVCSNLVYFTVGFCFGDRTYSTFGTFTEHLVWD